VLSILQTGHATIAATLDLVRPAAAPRRPGNETPPTVPDRLNKGKGSVENILFAWLPKNPAAQAGKSDRFRPNYQLSDDRLFVLS
jgi:hypothetical protein